MTFSVNEIFIGNKTKKNYNDTLIRGKKKKSNRKRKSTIMVLYLKDDKQCASENLWSYLGSLSFQWILPKIVDGSTMLRGLLSKPWILDEPQPDIGKQRFSKFPWLIPKIVDDNPMLKKTCSEVFLLHSNHRFWVRLCLIWETTSYLRCTLAHTKMFFLTRIWWLQRDQRILNDLMRGYSTFGFCGQKNHIK